VKKIRILVVDDHAVVREALKALLSPEPDMEVVGEAGDGWQAVKRVEELSPDVVLMDLAMPALNGLEASKQILRQDPCRRIIILSSYSDDRSVKNSIEAGVSGYLAKKSAAQELFRAIHDVHSGTAYFSPEIARRLRDQSRQAFGSAHGASNELTPREMEVLSLIARSYSNKETGAALGISVKTVEKHRQQVMNKLHIHDVAGLTLYASNLGILDQHLASSLPSEAATVAPQTPTEQTPV
jgi:DNA-binding NarL/FixJ family response regulator